MPLIKLFLKAGKPGLPPASVLHNAFGKIWAVPADVMKVLVIPVADWNESFEDETVYLDVRAKKKLERTPELVQQHLQEVRRLQAKPKLRTPLHSKRAQLGAHASLTLRLAGSVGALMC
jgi:hypothetical protein